MKGVSNIDRRDQMPYMGRIEGASEKTDAQTGGRGHPCSLETNICKGNKFKKVFANPCTKSCRWTNVKYPATTPSHGF